MAALVASSCGGTGHGAAEPALAPTLIVSVVGTNDLHGHVHALPVLAGYLAVLREVRAADGAVVLIDGGDMFQGTLESNLLEGSPIVTAYGALGYDAVTIGNHEFDYGPVGERSVPTEPGDDPRGALLSRAAEAHYPFLAANLRTRTGDPIEWDHVRASTLIERAGLSIGIIGVTTEETLSTTNAANVTDLAMAPIAREVAREASALRERGAQIVLVAAHAGGNCTEFHDPHDLSSCEADQEIFEVARALPEGTVDVIVAGHTHQGVSHLVNGIPIVESFSYGRAFGRVDLVVERASGRVRDVRVHPPQDLCEAGSADGGDCTPGTYEGRAVPVDARIAALMQPSVDNAAELRVRPLGVTIVDGPIRASRPEECALGNLFTDLMRAAQHTDVALTNGGGLRADLPEGELTYGQLYGAMPFDNVFATIRLTGAELARFVADNLQRSGSFMSLSGVRATARCVGGALVATLTRDDGRAIGDDEMLTLATSDFLATETGGSFAVIGQRQGAISIENDAPVRDSMARILTERGGTLRASQLYDPAAPRIRFEGTRPIECP